MVQHMAQCQLWGYGWRPQGTISYQAQGILNKLTNLPNIAMAILRTMPSRRAAQELERLKQSIDWKVDVIKAVSTEIFSRQIGGNLIKLFRGDRGSRDIGSIIELSKRKKNPFMAEKTSQATPEPASNERKCTHRT